MVGKAEASAVEVKGEAAEKTSRLLVTKCGRSRASSCSSKWHSQRPAF